MNIFPLNADSRNTDNLVDAVLAAPQPLVLFRSSGMVMATPLSQAYRFDEVDYTAGETIALQNNQPMTVHSISKLSTGRKPVILFGPAGALQGLIVDEIMDIIAYEGRLSPASQASAGTALIRGRVTEIINLEWFLSLNAQAA